MKRLPTLLLLILFLSLMTACQSYTTRQGLDSISIPIEMQEDLPVTKYSTIQASHLAEVVREEAESDRQAIERMLGEAEHLQSRLSDATQQIDQLTQLLDRKDEETEELNMAIVLLKKHDASSAAQLGDTLAELSDLKTLHQTLTEERKELASSLEVARAEIERLQTHDASLVVQLEDALFELSNVRARYQELIEEQEKLADSLEDTRTEMEYLEKGEASTAAQLRNALAELSDLKTRHQTLIEEREELAGSLEDAQAEIDHLGRELSLRLYQGNELIEELSLQEGEIEELHTTIIQMQSELTEAGQTIATLQEKNHNQEQVRKELDLRLRQTEQVLATYRQAELEALKSEEDRALALAAQAERERLLAEEREALQRQIPSIEQLTLPHLFIPNPPAMQANDESELKTVILPLSDSRWTDARTVNEVAHSISDLDYPLILVTGEMNNVIALVRQLARNAVLVDGGAIITSLPILETTAHGAKIRFNEQKTIRVLIANLVEYEVLSAFEEGGDQWMEIQEQVTPARLKKLEEILSGGTVVEPTIIGASLYEPSHRDWSSFSPIEYRQIDYLWPLAAALEEKNFFDGYRMTHFSSATDSGNTFVKAELQERLDYLFSRKLLPLTTSMVTIGGESTPKEEGGIQRWGILASYLIP